MINAVPLACFLSMIRPPGVQFDNALLQIAPVDKTKCPLVRDSSDVQFQLYTRYNPTVYQELVIGDDEKLMASHMDFHAKTVIFFHAFMEMPEDGSGVLVREAYMLRGDVNMIMVDASELEAGPWYFTAADNTWYIGRFAAKFIDYLVSRGLDLSKTHLIGHSLGAQAAGVAGAFLTSGRVSRITGLDPALPLFAKLPLEQRLDPSDAEFVDVIHTDAGIFGVPQPTGHADFYPNGGISPQPGCELEVVLHQQNFFNKCDSSMKPHGYYTFDLQPVTEHEKRTDRQTYQHKNIETDTDTKYHKDVKKMHATYYKKTKDINKYDAVKNKELITEVKDSNIFKGNINTNVETHEEKTQGIEITLEDENIDSTLDLEAVESDLEATLTRIKLKKIDNEKLKKERQEIKAKSKKLTDVTSKTKTLLDSFPNTDLYTNFDVNPKETHTFVDANTNAQTHTESHVKKRQKRFLSFFQRNEATESENFLFRILEFLNKNRKNVIPVFTVMREINTLVKSANGELNHSTKERNNYIGHNPPILPLATYNLELGSDSKVKAFVKRLLGLKVEGDRLSITGK